MGRPGLASSTARMRKSTAGRNSRHDRHARTPCPSARLAAVMLWGHSIYELTAGTLVLAKPGAEASRLKTKQPHSAITIRDMETGEVTAVKHPLQSR